MLIVDIYKVPIEWSLIGIAAIITTSILLSMKISPKSPVNL
jgi:hypothetical protein